MPNVTQTQLGGVGSGGEGTVRVRVVADLSWPFTVPFLSVNVTVCGFGSSSISERIAGPSSESG